MVAYIRTDLADRGFVKRVAFFAKLAEQASQCANVVKDQTVCHQVIVFDQLSLFVAIIFLDDTIGTKPDPLNEIVELLEAV